MSLSPGTKLGPYEIVAPIGAGGMGEVYKAKDTRLDRIVAVKVLPSHLSDNAELKHRFEREARAVSSLNHPHICTLYDIHLRQGYGGQVGDEEEIDFMVLEYLEGETLADRLKKGALPLDQALRYAIEIADALDKAHRQGVVHRDLKPGNIMLTKSGAKLLDFGLAKLGNLPRHSLGEGGSALPTEEKPLTEKGSILGTFQYMAPEQLEGKEADARTDLFAFGAVLYEMVTGRRAFEGKSQASLIGAIMTSDPPPISQLHAMSPPALDHVVKTCLAKDPDDRWQMAGDVERQLKWIAERGSLAGVPEFVARRPSRSLAWGIVIGLMAGAIAAGITVWSVTRPADELPMRFPVEFSPREALYSNSGSVVALSPDGSRVVYVAEAGGAPGEHPLYIRSLDRLEATKLSGTEGALQPFFSPDGEWVAFRSESKLKKVSVYGGAPITLCNAPQSRGGSWGSDDTIVFARGNTTGLFRVPAVGGTPEEVTVLGEGERSHRWPHILPDGKALLFISQATDENYDDANIEVISLATGERKVVLEGGTQPRYVPTGHLVFARQGTLFGAPFDLDRLETTAPPAPIIEAIISAGTIAGDGSAQYAFSKTGILIYLSGVAEFVESYTLVWVDREGTLSSLYEQKDDYSTPRFSPDGRRLALILFEDVWIYELERGAMTRLTFDPDFDGFPVWSPDGERLAFCSLRGGGPPNLFWKRTDGTEEAERLTECGNRQYVTAWSPDGKVLAFSEQDPETDWDIWVLPLEGKREPQLILRTPFIEIYPRFSPDGRWLAYQSNESGRYEIYVQPYPGPGGKWQISTSGGVHPLWEPDGRELFYRQGDRMMVVSFTVEGESFRAGRPRELFQGQFRFGPDPSADIAPDGKGFVMLKSATAEEGKPQPTRPILVMNWFDELERLVPR